MKNQEFIISENAEMIVLQYLEYEPTASILEIDDQRKQQ